MRLRHAALPPHRRSMHTQTQNHRFQHLYTTCNIAGNDNMLCMVPCMLFVPCSFAVPTIPYRCTVHRSMWACCDTPQAPRSRPAGSQALNPTSIYRGTGMHKDLWCLHEGVYTSMQVHPPSRHVPEIPHADRTCLRPRRSKPAIYTGEEPGFFILCPARLGHINDCSVVRCSCRQRPPPWMCPVQPLAPLMADVFSGVTSSCANSVAGAPGGVRLTYRQSLRMCSDGMKFCIGIVGSVTSMLTMACDRELRPPKPRRQVQFHILRCSSHHA